MFNDALTFCFKKSILTRIKTSIFVFLISQIPSLVNNFYSLLLRQRNFIFFYMCILYVSNYISTNLQNNIAFVKYLNIAFIAFHKKAS